MHIIVLDWETYYDKEFSLRKLTTEEYVRDPRFEIIGVSIKVGDKPARWYPQSQVAAVVAKIPWGKVALLAHNAAFDCFILNEHFGAVPKFILDTMSMAKPWHHDNIGCSLSALVKHYGITIDGRQKGNEIIMAEGKRFGDFTPAELAAYGRYCCDDSELTYRLFEVLQKKTPRMELLRIDAVLRTFVQPQLVLDKALLQEHLADTVARKEALLAQVEQWAGRSALSSNKQFITVLETLGGRKPPEMFPTQEEYQAYMLGFGTPGKFVIPTKTREATPTEQKKGITGEVIVWAISKKDEVFLKLVDGEDEELAAVCAARLGVKSTIAESRATRLIAAADRGAFPISLLYYAAHTGRLGGSEKSNAQNFPKAKELTPKDVGFKGMTPAGPAVILSVDPVNKQAVTTKGAFEGKAFRDATTLTVRHCIKAPPGCAIVVADASQIEARIVGWNAEQEDLVEKFRNKEDIYSDFATPVYGYPCNKKDNPVERFVGKTCIAEGELVLTDQGLVPIEKVSYIHRVWDGVEWVTHDGPIYQGEKEVITYDSLTATPDHVVYLEDGTTTTFGEAATTRAVIAVSNVCWVPTVPDNFAPRTHRVWDILNAGPRHRFTVSGRLVSNCILGLGFGTGAAKLQDTLAIGQGDIRVNVSLEEAQRMVHIYRKEKYPQIPKLWRQHQAALDALYRGEEFSFGIRDILQVRDGAIWLPNGMPIRYPKLDWVESENDKGYQYWGKKEGRYQMTRIYGAKSTENTTQALAGIVVGEAWVRINHRYRKEYGRLAYPIAMQVHDELVGVVPEDEAKDFLQFMIDEMRKPPAWAYDLPLDAEGDIGRTYAEGK